jgi:aerotaxis receptor
MRINLPVTPVEYILAADDSLVSVTDLKGRITYCNLAFIQASGYSREELMGQPHNLVRHPDMPAEAFRDMWSTIQAGLPWSAPVKNRRKDGTFYWVQAHATPMMEGNRTVGYLSVRTAPSREAVAKADQLYARMRSEAERGGKLIHVLHHGCVRLDTVLGRLQHTLTPGPTAEMLAACAVACSVSAGAVALLGPWGAVLAPLAALGAAAWIYQRMYRPLEDVLSDTRRLASGDLATPISSGGSGLAGQLRHNIVQLRVNLRTIVGDTHAQLSELRSATQEIASGNHDLSRRTESQAASLEQTAASMEEINVTVGHSAASAQDGLQGARVTAESTAKGTEAVHAMAETMGEISESSRRIRDIIQTVESVAFQTNILALNAAVEAARAGEAGRGFAVVATEVRQLATRSSDAARQIKQLIHESSTRVDQGQARTTQATERMDKVRDQVQKVEQTLESIARSAVEQQSGIAQISQAVNQMETITQQNAALVEQLAAAATALQGQVTEVDHSISLLRLRSNETGVVGRDAVSLRKAAHGAAEQPLAEVD